MMKLLSLFLVVLTHLVSGQVYGPWTCDTGDVDGCMIDNQFIYSGSTLTEPTVIDTSSVTAFDITVESCTHTAAGFATWTARCYCYNSACSIPGPTILAKPGNVFNVTLKNDLTLGAGNSYETNTFHSPYNTNLHTHGLHISSRIDNVFVELEPGESHVYQYEIKDDHHPGLHWYHSHIHGASALQVMGGLVGAIVIEPEDASTDYHASLQAMDRKTLVMMHVDLSEQDQEKSTGAAYTDPFTVFRYGKLQTEAGDDLAPSTTFLGAANVGDAWLTNGMYQPTYAMDKDSWQIFDIVVATGDRVLELELVSSLPSTDVGNINSAYDPEPNCEVQLLAVDGVYVDTPRNNGYVQHMVIVQAGRASIAVKCTVAGTYYLASTFSSGVFNEEITGGIQNLLTITVSNTAGSASVNPDLTGIPRPTYLADLTNEQTNGSLSVAVEQTFADTSGFGSASYAAGVGTNCQMHCFGRSDCDNLCASGGYCDTNTCDGSNGYGSCSGTDWAGVQTYDTCTYIPMDGSQGDDSTSASYPARFDLNTLVHLTFWGRGKAAHPMHIHVNHFMLSNYTDSNGAVTTEGWWGMEGDYRDTMPALPGLIQGKMWFVDYEGEVVLHCHFLKHEDLGMMDTIYVGTLGTGSSGDSTTDPTSDDDETLSTGAIVGIAVGGAVVGAALIAGTAYVLMGSAASSASAGSASASGSAAMIVSKSAADGDIAPQASGHASGHGAHAGEYELTATDADPV